MPLEDDALRWGAWLPDQPPFANEGCLVAENVLPTPQGFDSARGLAKFAEAVHATEKVVASLLAFDSVGNRRTLAATPNRLHLLQSDGNWRDVSESGQDYADSNTGWSLEVFRNTVIAANGSDPLSAFELPGTSMSTFEEITDAPAAAYVASVRNFLLAGNLSDDPTALRWSGFGNYEQWEPSLRTQSDFQDMPSDDGPIRAILSGTVGLVFQDYALTEFEYVGPPVVFKRTIRVHERGTPAPRSVVRYGKFAYYYSHDGFYAYDYGAGVSEPIGHNRVDQWFEDNCPPSRRGEIEASISIREGLVLWAFATTADGVNDRILVYNWVVDRWSYLTLEVDTLGRIASPGKTLEELDSEGVYGGAGMASLDHADAPSLDSPQWQGGEPVLTAFDSEGVPSTFTGSPLDARLVSGEMSGRDGALMKVNELRPLLESCPGSTVSLRDRIRIRVGSRDDQFDSVDWPAYESINERGVAELRAKSRYQRYEMLVSGACFRYAQGLLLPKTRKMAGRKGR